METAWKSNNIKTEMQATLPPLVVDALVQTVVVQNPERRTFGTQTIKVENVEITRIDAVVQTDGSTLKDESCQTDKSKGTDFQMQVDLQTEKELSDTIQEENMEVSSTDDSEDDYESEEDFHNDSIEGSDNDSEDDFQTDSEAENWMMNVLDSEVYKIYCQDEDPKNAIEKIKKLKNCLFVHEPKTKNSQDIETGVKTIWSFFGLSTPFNEGFSPNLNIIKSFVLNQFGDLGDKYLDAFKLISQCTTTIEMLQPNGYEYWIVTDFEKGRGISKWYHGHACESVAAENLAFLNLSGIELPGIDHLFDDIKKMSDFVSDAGMIFNLSFIYHLIIKIHMITKLTSLNIIKKV